MKLRSVRFGAILSLLCVVLSSCLGDVDEDVDYEYADDAAIAAFSLGTLNKYTQTVSTKTGNDTIVKSTVAGSKYKFYIDQKEGLVYNPDSLPYGVDAKHVIATINTYNSGVAFIKSLTSDSLLRYSAKDSIDFTQPREVHVYSLSGAGVRKYTVTVNVHKQEGDSFKWNQQSTGVPFADCLKMRGVATGKGDKRQLFVGAVYADGARLFRNASGNGAEWEQLPAAEGFTPEAIGTMSVCGGNIYWSNNGTLYRTADGISVERVYSHDAFSLLGASLSSLYARQGDEVLSSVNGADWQQMALDGAVENLPTRDISVVWNHYNTVNEADVRVLLLGNRSAEDFPDDSYAVAWGYVEQTDLFAEQQPLSFYEWSETNQQLPRRLDDMQCARSGTAFYMMGNAGIGNTHYEPREAIYQSEDGGLTWQRSTNVTIPTGFTSDTGAYTLFSDDDNFLWIICGGTGNVWRGRVNKYGWTQQQMVFE